jgi:hypothetical protein
MQSNSAILQWCTPVSALCCTSGRVANTYQAGNPTPAVIHGRKQSHLIDESFNSITKSSSSKQQQQQLL